MRRRWRWEWKRDPIRTTCGWTLIWFWPIWLFGVANANSGRVPLAMWIVTGLWLVPPMTFWGIRAVVSAPRAIRRVRRYLDGNPPLRRVTEPVREDLRED